MDYTELGEYDLGDENLGDREEKMSNKDYGDNFEYGESEYKDESIVVSVSSGILTQLLPMTIGPNVEPND